MQRILRWLLYATIPIAIALQFMHGHLVAEFVFACAAVLPLAAWIGVSTEQLAHRMGSTYGALFNATFGNFAELIIAILAIRAGLPDVVRASLSGSIVGNLLFVAGVSMVAGGWGRASQTFNAAPGTMLTVAGMIVLRWTQPHLHRPYRVWAYPLPPIIFIVITVWMMIYLLHSQPKESLSAVATLLAGFALYYFAGKKIRPAQ